MKKSSFEDEEVVKSYFIATFKHPQTDCLRDGYRLGDFIVDGISHSVELNNKINRDWLFSQKIDGKWIIYIRQSGLNS